MNIRIDIDQNIQGKEIIIKCNAVDNEVLALQDMIHSALKHKRQVIFYKDEQEFYFPLKEIIFFETDSKGLTAHTEKDMFYVKHRLYELEEVLPDSFIRISKSSIVNTNKIYSILRNITSASKIEFRGTHKKVYVSRNYYSNLKSKLNEKRNIYE